MQYDIAPVSLQPPEVSFMSILISPFKHSSTPDLDKLFVVTTVFNPMRYKSRYELYEKFAEGMQRLGAQLMTVELAFGDRPFEITRAGDPMHVQLRTKDEFWLKESAINVGISRIPDPDWKYVGWFDADVEFHRQDLLDEIVHQLQHAQIVQCFEDAVDLGPRGEIIETHKGFVWSWWNKTEALNLVGGSWKELSKTYYGSLSLKTQKTRSSILHPGFAWAARREAITHLGGLLDIGILGASDHHAAWALVGDVLHHSPPNLTPGYVRHLKEWEKRATTHIRQNIGYVPGMLYHHFHGAKRNRKYNERWEILHRHVFDPDRDLKRDWNGLWTFSDVGVRLRNDIRRYLHERNEDSLER
jgi:hypothetical protein